MTIKSNGGIFGRNPTFNNVTVDGTLTVDQIVEKTGAAGITLDGVTLKDGNVVLADGKGIDFSATAGTGTSELFDDYEEGTWTPSVGGDATYLRQNGRYTKIGRQVTVQFDIEIDVIGTGSQTTISGLPFASAGSPAPAGGGGVAYYTSLNVNVSGSPMPRIDAGASGIVFTAPIGTFPDVNPTENIFKSATRLFGFATYAAS